jgi:hypothetical protein
LFPSHDLTAAGVALIEEAIPFLERAAASATRSIARPAFRILSAFRTADRLPGIVVAGTEEGKDFWAAHGGIDLADLGKIGLVIKEGVHYAGKSFSSARKASQSVMKSWRKRAADFGQWERRQKRKIVRQLGKDYRTLTGKKAAGPSKKPWRKTPGFPTQFGTRFRKSVKPRKSAKYVKRHYDDYGIISRDHALYAGFQKHGSQNRVCDIVAEALVRAVLASVHIYPRSYDEQVVEDFVGTEDMFETMTVLWRRIDEQSGVSSEAQESYSMKQTFEALSQAVGAHITAKLQDGYFPHEAFIYASDVGGTGNKRLAKRLTSLEDGRLEVIVKQTIRLQNLSPNRS